MTIWIDVDNPPQARYLTPFVPVLERRGHDVLVTARDNSITHELLDQAGVRFVSVGSGFGRGRPRKAWGVIGRAIRVRQIARNAKLLLSSSRSSALAARALSIPAFVMCDYEHVELGSYRRAGARLVFPEVIDRQVFVSKGFSEDRLVPFRGLKEDITFGGLQPSGTPPEILRDRRALTTVLLRPPAEHSHYFSSRSGALLGAVLDQLASESRVQVVFSPRELGQVDHLAARRWQREPLVLREAIPAADLFAGVDWVVCGGGTMLREAAYLGRPAIGIFGGQPGCVDAYLASEGAVRLIQHAGELSEIDWEHPPDGVALKRNPALVDDLVTILERELER
jgi:uncharacterized protein